MISLKHVRKYACLCLLLSALVVTSARPAAQKYAPLPDRIVAAKTMYLVNDSGYTKEFDKFYKDLRKWGRFTVVTNRETADLVAVLTIRSISVSAESIGVSTTIAPGVAMSTSQSSLMRGNAKTDGLHLRLFDARTGEQLWADLEFNKLAENLKKRMPEKGRLK